MRLLLVVYQINIDNDKLSQLTLHKLHTEVIDMYRAYIVSVS